MSKKFLTFSAILYWKEDVYVAECPEVETASQGETIEEAIAILNPSMRLINSPSTIAAPIKLVFTEVGK
jgi:hypothetical protein